MTQKTISNWSVKDLWVSQATTDERPLIARDYLYASEIGMPPIDTYLKMIAEPYSNPFNERAKRKMQMGVVFEAWIKYVLLRTGILQMEQKRIHIDIDGLLSVHGKQDFLAGGLVDPERFKYEFEGTWIPDPIKSMCGYFMERYAGKVLSEKSIEVKTISSFAANSMEIWEKPIKNHEMQAYHYASGQDMDSCTLLYLCRDDARAFEFDVQNNDYNRAKYVSWVKNITEYYNSKERPPVEPLIYFDYDLGKFTKNLGIEYSSYLTLIYNYKSPREYSDEMKPTVERWNRVLLRYAKEEKITAKNEDVRKEVESSGYDFDSLVYSRQEAMKKVIETEDENI